MHFEAANDVLAVVVVGSGRAIAVEHTDSVVDDAVTLHWEETTRSHHTDVTAKTSDTANVFITTQMLDSLAVIEDFEVDGVDGAFNREGGLELTNLDGKFIAGFVLHIGIDQRGAAAEITLDLVAHRLRQFAVD